MSRLGVIGRPSDWLIASNVDYKKAKSKFDIDLIDIEIDELIALYNLNSQAKPQYFLDFNKENSISKQEQDKAYVLYLAIKQLVEKYQLEGLTIRCFDLLKTICTTSCLAFALLNKEGIIATCEGDIPSMISMFLIKKHCKTSSFQANPSQISVEDNSILLAHCTVPLDMCKRYDLDTHFESGIGVAINGYLDKKDIYIFKIDSSLEKYILLEGSIIETPFHQNLCRTQVKIKLNKNSSVKYFLNKPLGNHHIIFYKTDIEKLINLIK